VTLARAEVTLARAEVTVARAEVALVRAEVTLVRPEVTVVRPEVTPARSLLRWYALAEFRRLARSIMAETTGLAFAAGTPAQRLLAGTDRPPTLDYEGTGLIRECQGSEGTEMLPANEEPWGASAPDFPGGRPTVGGHAWPPQRREPATSVPGSPPPPPAAPPGEDLRANGGDGRKIE
jgi:hypothetical protein